MLTKQYFDCNTLYLDPRYHGNDQKSARNQGMTLADTTWAQKKALVREQRELDPITKNFDV